ncbi:MAG: GIY-YIG nuclease family protein [Jaaginema sp. PMC 1079.18]|nr:GIY-YIG nuclease family protein [Jaaginema sp. PMC 1080.18]MEC4851902.1 GIY-YIG nuclease family protein [Jaaginema sp. PMC 1079.18]MEC4865216.1 GIY-YIG nuclease family protein [Jaaginema sp. PMC 1078.18]
MSLAVFLRVLVFMRFGTRLMLLYIGKTKSLRGRFSGGHKAFLWAWLDKYNDEDVRIALQVIPYWGNPALLLELEAVILRATEPPYNAQIPTER